MTSAHPHPAKPHVTFQPYDYVVIGSGFGGAVSAMRLSQKGYRVLILERGKRIRDEDFPKSNWNIWKFLWLPALRCFGAFQMSLFRGFFVFHSSGVGGGSLVYAGVLMEPDESFYDAPAWRHLGDWRKILQPHVETARRMLGVATNPKFWPADEALRKVAHELRLGNTFRPTEVGVFFGEEGVEVADPYFGGMGPTRKGCIHCGACMVGCRDNAKNDLSKNYLYFAEKWGAQILADVQAVDIRPLADAGQTEGRYEVVYRSSTGWVAGPTRTVRARNVILSAGVLGTLRLLFRCRDETGSLPKLSPRLGEMVRTNSEAFVGAFSRSQRDDHSKGLAITSIFQADEKTQVEPVRFSDGSSLIFWLLASPLIKGGGGLLVRIARSVGAVVRHPIDFLNAKFSRHLTRKGTALMIMQREDNQMRLRLGRSLLTVFRSGLVAEHDRAKTIPVDIALGDRVAMSFAEKIGGVPNGSVTEHILNVPTTAHMLGGCLFGRTADEGVVDLSCQVHDYPGLYVVDGCVVPANPGVNPTLTITALAEYAMSHVPVKPGDSLRPLSLGPAGQR